MATIKKAAFAQFVQNAQFAQLFNELGWNNARLSKPIDIDGDVFKINAVAEKNGFFIFTCSPDATGKIANYATRRKIDHQVSKIKELYVIIFTHKNSSEQIWQFTKRAVGKPKKVVETRCTSDPELLYQKVGGLFFSLDEEDNITITDVLSRVENSLAANADKVTKKFYDHFKREHQAFLGFIKGIGDTLHKDWYASLMLNRLMFCYFIQKKGFLDRNVHYLRDKLNESQQRQGKGQFYSFYRDFLLVLFHQGLNASIADPSVKSNIGQIPYLNGGLFDVHDLEQTYKIEISDDAFERIFNFFDQYDWHLNTEEGAKGNEINPDVIGYIFEKYINDRASMGAYYTKEDITEYIAKNCIVPFLFDQTERNGAKMSNIWANLTQSDEQYIYPSVKYGMTDNMVIPEEIVIGISTSEPNLLERRKDWNKPTPPPYGLPTEIWRETIERWRRYATTKNSIKNGDIKHINDFITHNLDIRLFVQDVIEQTDDADFLRHFYTALSKVTILDPTCGSGAFLFAALNILESLYEACLKRMAAFVEENPNKYRKFEEILADESDATRHPNREYFIYKKIIVQNLYGVDIMREATEIAKLRLFLKLMSTVRPDYTKKNMGLEPLPDVDFNIRAGNSLVGFATLDEAYTVIRHREGYFANDIILDISDAADKVKMAFSQFKSRNTEGGNLKAEKLKLKDELKKLNHTLSDYLARNYLGDVYKPAAYTAWLDSHQPFHWCAEFYEVLYDDKGKFKGFDVVIGNPPYVEYKDIDYKLHNFETIDCGNLYAYIMENSKKFQNKQGFCGMIVPMSGHSTDRMEELVKKYYNHYPTNYLFNISADANPSKLFEGVKFRLVIFIVSNKQGGRFSTRYKRWYAEERSNLFEQISFNNTIGFNYKNILPKISDSKHLSILQKITSKNKFFSLDIGNNTTYFHNAPVNWIRSHEFMPYFKSERDGEKASTQLKVLKFESVKEAKTASAIICSTLYYIWWITNSDCYHLNRPELTNFRFDFNDKLAVENLSNLYEELKIDMVSKSVRRTYNYKTSGIVEYDEYYMKKSKSIIDEIDKLLSAHYGFTEEELDFIINYDIKYRMGKELGDGEAE